MTETKPRVTIEEIRQAHQRIVDHIHRTPVIRSTRLDQLSASQLWFKCENLQKVGAFKARGALNAVLGLAPDIEAVATHSSGNHGAALAMAASVRGLKAYIVMPENASVVKKEAVKGYAGIVVECEPTLAAREASLRQVVEETGAHVIHPYDDDRIIAGQGTVGLEVLDQLQEIDAIVLPVGGGGLLAGVATAIKSLRPGIEVIAIGRVPPPVQRVEEFVGRARPSAACFGFAA